MDKIYRRTQILAIVGSGTAATQTALRRKLAQRGIHVTQATVSRDIEELGLVKTREGYRLPDGRQPAPPPQPGLPVLLKEFLRDVRQAANLIVLRTHPGTAHTVAVALDAAEWPEVAGTVAGDDTIFLATTGARQAGLVRKRILAHLAE
ncbi:MAG: ArgR family transcriptional regulator [Acidobacteria bacterium]|nr:MAG: ArgR family transcriptional regulator [Acidobacteriota bacterium]